MSDILTVREVAERYKVAESTVSEWARTGTKPAFKVGKLWRFSRAALEEHDADPVPHYCRVLGIQLMRGKPEPRDPKPPRENISWQSLRLRILRKATPRWADRDAIAALYRQARYLTRRTGVAHHVDHIEPLQGKNSCGLHVEYNLRVITARENQRKSNKL